MARRDTLMPEENGSSSRRHSEPAGDDQRPAVARGAPQGSYVHPLQRQLEALRYPAWLLEPPEPLPPKVWFLPSLPWGHREAQSFPLGQHSTPCRHIMSLWICSKVGISNRAEFCETGPAAHRSYTRHSMDGVYIGL